MNWQPIDTAPKDGTFVLLWTAGGITEASYYHGGWDCFPTESSYSETGRAVLTFRPTHWCPLPKAPIQDSSIA